MLLAAFMNLLDVSIVNIAIPSIQRNLHASYADVQWALAGYTLAYALVLVTGGRHGDTFGRKRLFLVEPALAPASRAAAEGRRSAGPSRSRQASAGIGGPRMRSPKRAAPWIHRWMSSASSISPGSGRRHSGAGRPTSS